MTPIVDQARISESGAIEHLAIGVLGYVGPVCLTNALSWRCPSYSLPILGLDIAVRPLCP